MNTEFQAGYDTEAEEHLSFIKELDRTFDSETLYANLWVYCATEYRQLLKADDLNDFDQGRLKALKELRQKVINNT